MSYSVLALTSRVDLLTPATLRWPTLSSLREKRVKSSGVLLNLITWYTRHVA
jgi:hypothetical protein